MYTHSTSEHPDIYAAIKAELAPNLAVRPNHVASATIDTIVAMMRAEGREELVHYAGASYRDEVAWQMCRAWMADPASAERELKVRALAAVGL